MTMRKKADLNKQRDLNPLNQLRLMRRVRLMHWTKLMWQLGFPTSTLDSMINEAPAISKAVGLPEQGIELSPTDMERLAIAKR